MEKLLEHVEKLQEHVEKLQEPVGNNYAVEGLSWLKKNILSFFLDVSSVLRLVAN